MPLDIPIPFETIVNEEIETSRAYYIDWENGRITGFTNGKEAMRQFIKKALLTPRFKCLIYDGQYGSEIKETITDVNITREYIETELPFLIEDALIHDERVLGVKDINIEFGETHPFHDSLMVSFSVDTVFGEISGEEVI